MDTRKTTVMPAVDCSSFIGAFDAYSTLVLSTYNPNEIINVRILDGNNRVVEIGFADGQVVKNVRDEEDEFNIEECLYLALAKKLYRKEYTHEGILHMVEELKYKKDAVSIVKHGEKVYKEYLKEEETKKEETERRERKKAKKIAQKQRRKERARREQIEIQKQAYLEAMKEDAS
nr:MAG TPA: hypothetical protein [Bacteriophage sp.]